MSRGKDGDWGLDGRDAYEMLGVADDASPAEIKQAYRRAARATHPDLNGCPDRAAEERFRLVVSAYKALTERRAEYDAFRARPEAAEEQHEAAGNGAAPWAETAHVPDDPWKAAGHSPAAPPPSAAPRPSAPPRPTVPPQPFSPWPASGNRNPPPHQRPPFRPPPSYPRAGRGRVRRAASVVAIVLAVVWTVFVGFVLVATLATFVQAGEPEIKAAVPEKLAGTWSGTYRSADGGTKLKVSLTLREGRVRGGISYPHGECDGSLTPLGVDPKGAFVVREYSGDDHCDDADLHITHRGGELRVEYTDQGKMTPRAFIKEMKKKAPERA